jgi:hypothetical protein
MTGKLHPRIVGPGQCCYKLNKTYTVQFYRIHYYETTTLDSGPGQGCYKLNTTNTVQFYRIHYWETASPDIGPRARLLQTEHFKYTF